MDESINVGLQEQILAELTIELNKEPSFDADILKIKVNDAYRKVKSRKCYHNTSFSEKQIEKHLYENHYQDIKDVALYNFNMIGAEFQKTHNENGVSRSWRTEDEIIGNIISFVGIF